MQFTAVPWLRDHLRAEIATFLDQTELDPSAYAAMLRDAMQRLGRSVRGDGDFSLIDLMQSPEQRAVLDRLTARDVAAGGPRGLRDGRRRPERDPDVDHIRSKFNARRKSGNPLDQLVKRLLGLDAKLRQYTGRCRVRTTRGRPGRHGRLQRGLVRTGHAADQGRDRRARMRWLLPASTGSRYGELRGRLDPAVAAARGGRPGRAGRVAAGSTWCWSPAPAARTRSRSRRRPPSRRRSSGCVPVR